MRSNVEIIEEFTKKILNGELEGLENYFHDKYTSDQAFSNNLPITDKDGIIDLYKFDYEQRQYKENGHIEKMKIVADGDDVALFMNFKINIKGKITNYKFALLSELKDGKIIRQSLLADTFEWILRNDFEHIRDLVRNDDDRARIDEYLTKLDDEGYFDQEPSR